MTEHFLHFAWKNRLYDNTDLCTVSGNRLGIEHPGEYNRDAGPDFLNARIRIGNTLWAGNIEIHYRASSWYGHGHNTDHAYDNVILHVVVVNDRDCFTASGNLMETFLLSVHGEVFNKYIDYMKDESDIPCINDLPLLDNYYIRHVIHLAAFERLGRKTAELVPYLQNTQNDWEETLYRLLAHDFGMKINSDPFLRLASALPLKIIHKHADNPLQVEALMFGVAGMLDPGLFVFKTGDEYFDLLCREYRVLAAKYKLTEMDPWVWKFHRLRPAAFPTIRISQLARLLCLNQGFFARLKDKAGLTDLMRALSCSASGYWETHYRFGVEAEKVPVKTGSILRRSLLINTLVPLVFLYGKQSGQPRYCDRACDLLDEMDPENNRITRQWEPAGIIPGSALESQGLIELAGQYCKNRDCLNCHIGTKLICLGKGFEPGEKLGLGEPET